MAPPSPAPHSALSQRILRPFLASVLGRLALCALSGTLLFLACADFDVWPLAWVGYLPLLVVLLDVDGQPRVQRPFLYGFVTGLFANGGGFYWIVGLLRRFGDLPLAAALPIFLLLIGYQAITFGFFASILCRIRRHVDTPVTWLAPLVWVACELCVPYIFPWYLSITQAWNPTVIQIADITGPLGVSFVLVLCNAAVWQAGALWLRAGQAEPDRQTRLHIAWRQPIAATLTIVCVLGYGVLRIHQIDAQRAAAPKVKVGVVQANVGIHQKFVPGLREAQHELHLRLSQQLTQQGAELLVWPESSYPFPLSRSFSQDFPEGDVRKLQRGYQTPLLFGALTVERRGLDAAAYNTALLLDRNSQVTGKFDKNFLLIFGEYLPFAKQLRFLKSLIPAISLFEHGNETTTFPFVHQGKTYSLGPMICYEDIIPAFGRRLFASATPPNLMVNITNDAWFGATSEPYEHLALAVYRAVEHRVDLVRSVNTGVSAYIDAAGRVYKKGPAVDPQLTPDAPPVAMVEDMALMQAGGLYQSLGETFGGGCFVVVLLLGFLARLRAGAPIKAGPLLLAFGVLHGAILAIALCAPGEGIFDATYQALAHRNEHALDQDVLFAATWHLALALMLGSLLSAVWLGRRLPAQGDIQPGRLELLLAIAATVILPVIAWGRMEGNTGSAVVLLLLSLCTALLGLRIGRWFQPKA